MDIKTTQKYIVESPKKLREVVDMLRSSKLKPVEALARLELVGKRAALTIKKVINVAISNAKQANLNPDDLIFKEIQVNEGPVLKRFRAGSRGRAKPYKKRMSHIRVVLTTKEQFKTKELKRIENNEVKTANTRKEIKELKK